jgi:hypothetical protein
MADMQSILTGQSQYDPVAKKTVPKNQAPAAAPAPPNNSQEIFDKIAQSMQYANTYDLGTVELENRFAAFDRGWEADKKVQDMRRDRKPAAPPPQAPLAEATATTEDFVQDIDSLRRDARAGLGQTSGDYGESATPDASASFAMDLKDLDGAFVARALQLLFVDGADINSYFAQLGAADFIAWFNTNLAGKGPWADKAIGTSAATRANFIAIWDRIPQIFGTPQINLIQFVALMSILVNEVGDTLGPIAERVGTKGHPGLAYAFDHIAELNKASYNNGGTNWTAFRCFNDAGFIAAHGAKALGAQLQKTADPAWQGDSYPAGFPTAVDPTKAGFIMEADFYKFRGRGLIQTTWRDGYVRLIDYVQSYTGTQPVIMARKTAWARMTPDDAASASSNADWDDLFMHSGLEIPCVAIAKHNASKGNYLDLSGDLKVLNGKGAGSIWRMGRSINAGSYADTFRSRVVAFCNLL